MEPRKSKNNLNQLPNQELSFMVYSRTYLIYLNQEVIRFYRNHEPEKKQETENYSWRDPS